MTSNLTITLRGQSHTADNPTRHEAMGLLTLLFLAGETEQQRIERLQQAIDSPGLFDFDLDDPKQQAQISAMVTTRLQNPVIEARLSKTLKAMFPALPDELVRYRLLELKDGVVQHDWVYKLEDIELLENIVVPTLHYFQAEDETPTSGQGFAPKKAPKKSRRPRQALSSSAE